MSATGTSRADVVTCPSCSTKNRVPAAAAGAPRCGRCQKPLPWVVDTSDGDFAVVADGSTIPVLVDVWAPWCAPCRKVSPALEQLAGEFAGELKLVKVNADGAPQVSRRFDVQAIPTLVLMHHGAVVEKQVGAAPLPVLRSWLTEHLPQHKARVTPGADPTAGDHQP